MGGKNKAEQSEDDLIASIRREIGTAGHSTLTWKSFERLGGLSEGGARDWAAHFCARPSVGLRATVHEDGVGFWPDSPEKPLHELVPPTDES